MIVAPMYKTARFCSYSNRPGRAKQPERILKMSSKKKKQNQNAQSDCGCGCGKNATDDMKNRVDMLNSNQIDETPKNPPKKNGGNRSEN